MTEQLSPQDALANGFCPRGHAGPTPVHNHQDCLAAADTALAALKAAGYSLWRKFTEEEEEANFW